MPCLGASMTIRCQKFDGMMFLDFHDETVPYGLSRMRQSLALPKREMISRKVVIFRSIDTGHQSLHLAEACQAISMRHAEVVSA